MKKRVVSMLLALVMIVTMVVTSIPTLAATPVQLKVTADNAAPSPGDKVNFTVLLGSVANAGTLQFTLKIPTGLTIDDSSISIPDDLTTVMDSDGAIVKPSSSNGYTWGWSAQNNGYTGTSDLKLVGFSCTVDDGITGEKSVTIDVSAFTDNDELTPIEYAITPATVNIAAAPATYTVTVNGGTGVTVNSTQTVNQGEAITDVVIEAWDDYYFPEGYGVNSGKFGINVTRNSPSKITVSGTPTADVTINLPAAAKKDTQEPPVVGHTDCTAAGVNDGTITGLTAFMQWKMGDTGDNWNNVSSGETELTGRAPGTYYVRYKATDTKMASEPATVVINAYDPTVEKVTVTYKANGGTGADHSVQVDKGSGHVILGADACHFTAPAGERLVYWSNREDNGQGSEQYSAGYEYRNVQSNLTFYAVWEPTTRTVFLNAGEGGGDEISETVTYDQTYTLPGVPETFTAPNGKEFDCWKIQGDNTNTSYNPSDSYTIKGNVKFVAQWKDKQGGGEQQGYTLTFKPGDGSGDNYVVNGIDTLQYTLPDVPDTFTAPADKPIFAGWKAEGGNVVYPAGTVIPVNADATFVAQWKANGPQGDTVLVTFKPGDGTGDAFELRVPAGDSYRLPAKPAGFKAPAGKVFAGWKIEDPQGNLNEKLYKAGHKFDLTGDVTFVAQWKTRPYYGDDTTTPDADPMVNPGTGAAPVGAPIAVVIAVAVAGAAYFVTTKKR